jgi:hypothetical protein
VTGETLPPVDAGADPLGLSLFFIRERAAHAGLAAMLVDSLQDSGFEPLLVATLDPAQSEQAATILRGGNWGSGPYLRSGGPPAVIVVTLDLLPLAPGVGHRAAHPALDNAKIVMAKTAARNLVNAGLPKAERYNALHSIDNAAQAWRIVRELLASHEQALRDTVERMRREFATDGAIEDLTRHGRRAKVELIEFEGQRAIRKTFKSTALRFMEREIEVMQALGPVRQEIPRLLARSPNSITIEYVGGGAVPPPKRRGLRPRPLPLAQVRQLADFIKASVAHGFDPVDLRADGNVIYIPGSLKLIDFEFWQPCNAATPPERSACLAGAGTLDRSQLPQATRRSLSPYPIGWYPSTLLSVNSFLYDPPWLQQLKRGAGFLLMTGRWLAVASVRRLGRIAATCARLIALDRSPCPASPRGIRRSAPSAH